MLISISSYSILAPAIFALLNVSNKIFYVRLISYLVLLGVLSEAIIKVLSRNYIESNVYINWYFIAEVPIYAVIFHNILDVEWDKKLNKYFGIFVVVFGLINILFFQGMFQENSYSYVLISIFITVLCVLYFKQTLNLPENEILIQRPDFWFVVGMFIYHVGNFFVFMLVRKSYNGEIALTFSLWDIHSVVNIILNICLTITLWKARKFRISPTL